MTEAEPGDDPLAPWRVSGADFPESITELEVPVYVIQGEFEPPALARQWFRQLEAPEKKPIRIEAAAHRPLFQGPAQFLAVLDEVVPKAGITEAGGDDDC